MELSTISRIGRINFMLDKKTKQRVISRFKVHDTDTGSPQVQIAILTEEIKQLADHLKKHKHDHSSRRGLLKKVDNRRKLIKYLQKEDNKAFVDISKKLNLKISKKLIEEEKIKEELRRQEDLELLAKENRKIEKENKKLKKEKESENE